MERTMAPEVKTFNDDKLRKLIKESPKYVRDYIKAQKNIIDNSHSIVNTAIAKIKSQAKENSEMKEALEATNQYFVDLQNKCALTSNDEKAWKMVSKILSK